MPSQAALRAASRSGARRTAFIHMAQPTLHENVTSEAGTVISSTAAAALAAACCMSNMTAWCAAASLGQLRSTSFTS